MATETDDARVRVFLPAVGLFGRSKTSVNPTERFGDAYRAYCTRVRRWI